MQSRKTEGSGPKVFPQYLRGGWDDTTLHTPRRGDANLTYLVGYWPRGEFWRFRVRGFTKVGESRRSSNEEDRWP